MSSQFISYWEDLEPDGLFLAWLGERAVGPLLACSAAADLEQGGCAMDPDMETAEFRPSSSGCLASFGSSAASACAAAETALFAQDRYGAEIALSRDSRQRRDRDLRIAAVPMVYKQRAKPGIALFQLKGERSRWPSWLESPHSMAGSAG